MLGLHSVEDSAHLVLGENQRLLAGAMYAYQLAEATELAAEDCPHRLQFGAALSGGPGQPTAGR